MKRIPTTVLYDIIKRIEKREPVNMAVFELVDLMKEVCELRSLVERQNKLLEKQAHFIDKFIDRG